MAHCKRGTDIPVGGLGLVGIEGGSSPDGGARSGWVCRRVIRAALLLAGCAAALVGCDSPPPGFEVNRVYARNQGLARDVADFETPEVQRQLGDVRYVVTVLFGTPGQPALPEFQQTDTGSLLTLPALREAAGAGRAAAPGQVSGLYRDYCAACHGISGAATTPIARLLNPYPNDFRRGIFKYKTTPSTMPPTNADLHRVLKNGVPGTAMRSFQELPDAQRESLIQYVRYLSIRGQVERELITEVAVVLDEDEQLLDPALQEIDRVTYDERVELLSEAAEDFAAPWAEAEDNITLVPPPPSRFDSADSRARGRELFFTTLTNCAKCHGSTALGDGQVDDYDDWTKELEPDNEAVLRDYLALGALPPRHSRPRNLHDGIYRGGDRVEDLYVKIKNGIAGTTMPSVATQLTDDDIWHLVAYARSIPQDAIGHLE